MRHWSDPDLVEHLDAAASQFKVAELADTCRQLVEDAKQRPDPVEYETAKAVLKLLQGRRRSSLVQDVAETLLAHGIDTPRIRHACALALLDQGRTAAAQSLLLGIQGGSPFMRTEIEAAIGRVHKQRYLTTGPAAGDLRERDLAQAVERYRAIYDPESPQTFYHGINAASLMAKAMRDGVALPGRQDPLGEARSIAERVVSQIATVPQPEQWDLATAAEACLVLEKHDEAFEWTDRYVRSPLTAFQCGSTLRQFQQVWELDVHSEPGLHLLPLLRNCLLQAEGGTITVNPSEYTPESLQRFDAVTQAQQERPDFVAEKVLGTDRWQSVLWLRDGLNACRSVARIETYYKKGFGTGFVVAGNELNPAWPARVLVTNYHVVPDDRAAREAWISFKGLSGDGPDAQQRVQATKVLRRSPVYDYDVCVLQLPDNLSDEVKALPISPEFPDLGSEPAPRAYVIGHPEGAEDLQLSLHDTKLLQPYEKYAYYRSPTEAGSSGSPVFDDKWRIIALHHGSRASYPGSTEPANEGIRFDELGAHLRQGR